MLGKEFKGKTVCDFYAAYNRLLNEIQRCWTHLLRDLHALKEQQAERPEVVRWARAVKLVYEDAKAQAERADAQQLNAMQRRRLRERSEALLEAMAEPVARRHNAPHSVLAQRIMKHLGELFVFVEHPQVPADNNLAERSLRPAVTARKVSGGTRSDKGSETKMALLSHFGTWTLQNRGLLSACRNLLLTGSPTDPPKSSPA